MNALLEDAPPRPEPSPEPAEPPSGAEPVRKKTDRRWLIDVTIGVVSSLVVGLLLAGYQAWIDDERERLTQAVEADRAEREQVLANVQFIRETIRDAPEGVKPFRGMNLRGADLSGMDLGCPVSFDASVGWSRDRVETCADFTGADLTGARLDGANLTGALLVGGKLEDVSATNLFAPAAAIGGSLDGSTFDGAVLFASVFRSPTGVSSFVDTNLDGVQVEPGQEAGATFALTEVSMTGLRTVSSGEASGEASADGWASIDCDAGFAQARRGGEIQQVASYADLGDGGRVQCGTYGERCDFDRFPQVGAQLVTDGVWKLPEPATGCEDGFTGTSPEDTPAEEVTEFYDFLLPGWTREDIAQAKSL
ncbi:pentapeptide repeat-containing protein [Promicromonospora sukumoe]|uniref:pentapeptide repeat-containing protein n=1 Tax=Promicromonospora sukumoe TaxID=88382 RepID=UPI0003A4CF03|nr:pentapeptide repeat-containing protein [Promicromonospora sukumoe]